MSTAIDYQRMEKAIAYMAANWRAGPGVEELARQVGLGPSQFTRLFTRWAGISPKQYLRTLALAQAKDRLGAGEDLLSATDSAGLSGPGRLHDLFVDLEAVTPGEFKAGGRGLQIRHGWTETVFGLCHVAATERGLCSVRFVPEGERQAAVAELQAQWPLAQLVDDPAVTGVLAGTLEAMSTGAAPGPLKLLVRGTNFQVQVWRALLQIPLGETVSYGELAARLGRPSAARAVGTAVGANAIAFLIPCHRVLAAGGGLGGYRWGPARKRAMLAWETARRASGQPDPAA